ncbi:MAG: M24 family metallopeptidase [Desulfobacterales bacterium]
MTMTVFTNEEYLERIDKTKMRMAEMGMEVLVVSDPANMNYLTGYDGWSFYVPQVVIISLDKEEPLWVGREMDAAGARLTSFLRKDNIIGYPEYYVQIADRHPMEFVADVMIQRGWGKKVIGTETDTYYFSARGYEALKKGMYNASFIDGNLLVNWIRLIKSPHEINVMREAGKIVEKVMQTAIDVVAPGVRECDAAAEIMRAQIRGTEDFGGDYTAIVPLLPSGIKTSTAHLTWTDEPYENEVAVNLELSACRNRYHSPMARTLYLGSHPPQKLQDTAKVVVEGLNETLAAIKPGMLCEEVEKVWRDVISKAGLVKKSRIGYASGLNYPPDWGEHTASLRPGDKTILQANMTFHMILGMWMDDWGFEVSEAFRVTEDGHETFANFPRKLFVKE